MHRIWACPVTLGAAKQEDGTFKVPTEVRLFALGKTRTLKGDYSLDEKRAKKLIADFADYGNALTWDYEHGTWVEDGQPKPSPGFIPQGGLELRADGIYATGIDWNQRARDFMAAGEYRFFSQSFLPDGKGGIAQIGPPALVNWPATKGMAPLVAGGAGDNEMTTSRDLRTVKLTAFEDICDAVCAALTARFGQCWIVDLEDDSAVFEFGGRLMRIAYSVAQDGTVALGDQANEVERAYVPVEEGMIIMRSVFARLGLAADATESTVLSAVAGLKDLERDVLKLAGKPGLAEAMGALEGLVVKAGAYDKLRAEIDAQAAAEKTEKVEATYAAARAAGKTTLETEKAHRALHEDPDPVKLAAFFDASPVLFSPQIKQGGKSSTTSSTKAFEDMTTEEKHRLANDEPETFKALKRDADKRKRAASAD